MQLLDSSVWIAMFAASDVHHARAVNALETADGLIHVPYIVLEETATVLTYKHSKEQADKFVQFMLNDARILIVDSTAERDMEVFLTMPKRMSFADISIMSFASRMGLDLVTFDREMESEFQKAARSI